MLPTEAEVRDWLALSLVPGLGPRLTASLIEHFGNVANARRATVNELRVVPKIGEGLSRQFYDALQSVDVEAELHLMREHGVHVVIRGTPAYPTHLNTIHDAPWVLYVKGVLSPADINAVAVIGSRICTPYGKRVTAKLCRDLATAGYTVVSGLARGIDGEAHKGALEGGGRTLAVLAGGLSKIYPPEHKELAQKVSKSGALITETPMGMDPQKGMFHARNRLISGLSLGVVVVEANEKSGTLITVSHAAEQNRDVYAFPGNVDSDASGGTLELIRNQGAKLIRGIDDLLEDIQGIRTRPVVAMEAPTPVPTVPPPPVIPLDENQRKVFDLLTEAKHFDEILNSTNLSFPELTRLLMQMEMKKIVRRIPGNRYERRG